MIPVIRVTPADRALVEDALNLYADTIAPGVGGALNADPFFANAGNVGYRTFGGRAIALFHRFSHRGFEAHLICSRPWRGVHAVDFGRAALHAVFTVEGAFVITAVIPRDNKPSRRICRALGGTPDADTVDSLGRPCTRYILERATWATCLGKSLE